MQKIIPHLWFDKQAKAAADFYVSVFPNAKILSSSVIHNTPSGDTEMVSFAIENYNFMAISAGPVFKLNPAISFMVNFDPAKNQNAGADLDTLWNKLAEGGQILMPLGEYPFSKRYGWLNDRFGVSWQLILTRPEGQERPAIIPSLLFTQEVSGKAEEATDFYISVFSGSGENSKRGALIKYGAENPGEKEGTVNFTDFSLAGQWFAAMDSAREHKFKFNEAVSLIVNCKDQAEIDYFWEKLSAVPQAEQCGWLKDKYGLSWQIVPKDMAKYMQGAPEQTERVTRAFLQMKKFDLAKLKAAYEG